MEMNSAGAGAGVARSIGRGHLSHLPQRPPVTLAFHDLTYSVRVGKSSKIILRGIHGEFRSGQLTAILGPSGAGKSTLLNVLAGYRVEGAGGHVYTNGEPRDLRQFRKLSRYIMQEDLLQPYITIREAMLIAADLKIGVGITAQAKLVVVEEILQLLMLSKAKDTTAEKLSGGEKKRLSVALELLNNPPIIFLDEPTTGLDEVASSMCVSLLKRVARGGRTVVCSVHTPSARLFAHFDHVYVVADGRCAYHGAAAGVVPFLHCLHLSCPTTHNPADFIIDVSSGEYGSHVNKMVAAIENGRSQKWRDYEVPDSSQELELEQLNSSGVETCKALKHGSTAWQQFRILLRRMMLQTVRNRRHLLLRMSLHVFLGLIIGLLFSDMGYDASKTVFNYNFFYVCLIAMMYMPMMPPLSTFPREVHLIKREYFNRWYGLKAYYAAHITCRTLATTVFSLIFLAFVYPITSQPMELPRILMYTAICVAVAWISESIGIAIASTLNVVNSVFLGPVLCVPLMLLAVYGYGMGDQPLPIIWEVMRSCSYLRYGMEGLVAAIYSERKEDLVCPEYADYCMYKSIVNFLRLMGMSGVSFWFDFGVLVVVLLLMNFLGYYLLRQRLSPNYAYRSIKIIGNYVKTKMIMSHQ
ncbi:LOW QUALITY PROTEIN: ATP-binding cassette sub-family G member 1-like [Galleria mellonella]|uniref:LOW QUALITY PROTEIN: ATP-binding cassette sub-family G member 1-like n=1 Tax=Galleria mellonella TaxID=7137 RepID=A0ABM3MT77_GALME|nr:LOW QUALITY PROTEIN: ATP-binding cassette sub-family G member 1-like [Galleria mellonella]